MLLSPSLSRNKQNGRLSVSLCFIIQAQHFPLLGQFFFGQSHSFTFGQPISNPPLTTFSIAIIRTAASRLFACEPTINNCRRTANARINFYRLYRAIQSTRAALHTQIFVGYLCLFPTNIKHSMRADFRTASATNAFIGIIFKSCNIF